MAADLTRGQVMDALEQLIWGGTASWLGEDLAHAMAIFEGTGRISERLMEVVQDHVQVREVERLEQQVAQTALRETALEAMKKKGRKVHWRIAGQRKTACGLVLNPQREPYNAPAADYDPEKVTCKSCLGSSGLRELRSKWPPVRVLSASFSLEGPPEGRTRVFSYRRRMTPEEVAVVTTLLEERVPSLLEEPDPKIVTAYRAAKAAAERRDADGS